MISGSHDSQTSADVSNVGAFQVRSGEKDTADTSVLQVILS